MQRGAAGVVVFLMGVVAFLGIGCVSQEQYDTAVLRNREQEKVLKDREMEAATLNERVAALQAARGDAQRILTEKDDHLATLAKKCDAYEKAYKEIYADYVKLAEMPRYFGSGGYGESTNKALQSLADQFKDFIIYDPVTGMLRFKGDVTFPSGSDAVSAEAKAALAKLATILNSDDGKQIKLEVVGHTDIDKVTKPATIKLLQDRKKPTNNQGLSEARAEAVAEALKAAGIAAGRVTTKGVGDVQPVDNRTTADAKAKNRRVEIFLTGPGTTPTSTPPVTPKGPTTPAKAPTAVP
jgi:chemotaxis protein MotB